MAILASGKLADESMPVENLAPGGFAHRGNSNFPLSLTRCNKLAAHFRDSIKRLGSHPSAADWQADLERLEAHIRQVQARKKARRRPHTATCPTCSAEHDFDSAKEADIALREWKRK